MFLYVGFSRRIDFETRPLFTHDNKAGSYGPGPRISMLDDVRTIVCCPFFIVNLVIPSRSPIHPVPGVHRSFVFFDVVLNPIISENPFGVFWKNAPKSTSALNVTTWVVIFELDNFHAPWLFVKTRFARHNFWNFVSPSMKWY